MKIEQIRSANVAKPFTGRAYCISHVYIDGRYSHDTIEDIDRGLDESMSLEKIKAVKVDGKTAIPTGRYLVTLNVVSPTFARKDYYLRFCQGKLPRLQAVKGYSGILIHPGVDENSSAGCLICGLNKEVGKVTQSKATFERIYAQMKAAALRGEKIEYIITRKYKV